MLFTTPTFAMFFLVVLAAHRLCSPPRRWTLLLSASLLFYFMWFPVYLLLLVAEIVISHFLLRGIARGSHRRKYLIASLAFSLGALGFFKYAAFLVESASPLFLLTLGFSFDPPSILLPLGISFFTFQMIGFAVDTYRGETEHLPSLGQYSLFVSFFPQLIAGPILRGHQLLPQIRDGGSITYERTRSGMWLIASGLLKKLVVADFLLAPYADEVFRDPVGLGSVAVWIGVYSFAFQIYFDFSGYTDIARGLARLLGIELPANFREPYLARNPAEFWRCWHITLSRWLRDYLYIPLGGNRNGTGKVYRNLMITMLLGGLWHGAGWNFLVWGGLHGLLLVAHRMLAPRTPHADADLSFRDVPAVFALFHVVCVLWVFFRAEDIDSAALLLRELVSPAGDTWPAIQGAIVACCMASHVAERWVRCNIERIWSGFAGSRGGLVEGALLGMALGLALALGGAGGEFIYFQF